MGLFDSVSGALQALLGGGQSVPSQIGPLLAQTDVGGLQGIVAKLAESGFGGHVQSWQGDGPNLPISADELRAVLSDEHVQQIAGQLGLPVGDAMKLLAEHLPTAVAQASSGSGPPTAS